MAGNKVELDLTENVAILQCGHCAQVISRGDIQAFGFEHGGKTYHTHSEVVNEKWTSVVSQPCAKSPDGKHALTQA